MDSVHSVTANEGTTHTALREPPPTRLVFEPITPPGVTPSGDIDGKSIKITANNTKTLSNINNNIDNGTVVMLHGWAQNVHVFSNRCKKLVQRLRQQGGYRVVFLQAPHRLPPKKVIMLAEDSAVSNDVISDKTATTTSREYAYGWFLYDEDTVDIPRPSPTGDYPGMNESLQLLQHELERLYRLYPSTPIFLLGFSQGAVIVHKVATLACQTTEAMPETTIPSLNNPWRLVKNCVLVSGFPFRERPAATSLEKYELSHHDRRRIIIPSLHVVGRRDTRVPPHRSRQVYDQEEFFGRSDDFKVWEHGRGHVLPTDQAFCAFVIQFLQGE